ncbi:unnamed protein product [Gadus morhua 'NCC']
MIPAAGSGPLLFLLPPSPLPVSTRGTIVIIIIIPPGQVVVMQPPPPPTTTTSESPELIPNPRYTSTTQPIKYTLLDTIKTLSNPSAQ